MSTDRHPTDQLVGSSRTEPARRLIREQGLRWLTVLTCTAAATGTWAVAVRVLGADLAVRSGSNSVSPIPGLAVTLVSLTAGLAGWLLLVLLERTLAPATARRVWRLIAAAVLLLSLLGPLAAADAASTVVLLVLHMLVGGILLVALPGPVGVRTTTPADRS